ncbi:PTS IIA-like nitrogen regulatory protein PtsN [uncultured Enterovirga sp.]|uniref:PTS IIA-like nitrogen regulatory protein PtsN n=1 Tax=uncultured Enterovirga sp. TaxID=2026352 RepID=UPI0035CB5D34
MPQLDFLSPDAIAPALRASSKKQALHDIAAQASRLVGRDEREIFDTLLQRERLGSTGIGEGIAIPHGKLPKLDRLFGLFARLERPIDFEAIDGEPVDMLFLLLAPEGAGADHLKALARIARMLREPGIHGRIRAARDAGALYAVLTQEHTPRAA